MYEHRLTTIVASTIAVALVILGAVTAVTPDLRAAGLAVPSLAGLTDASLALALAQIVMGAMLGAAAATGPRSAAVGAIAASAVLTVAGIAGVVVGSPFGASTAHDFMNLLSGAALAGATAMSARAQEIEERRAADRAASLAPAPRLVSNGARSVVLHPSTGAPAPRDGITSGWSDPAAAASRPSIPAATPSR